MEEIQSKYLLTGLEITISKLSVVSHPIIIIGLYRPPNSKCIWFDILKDLLLELTVEGKIVVLGDLNCDLLRPDKPITRALLSVF